MITISSDVIRGCNDTIILSILEKNSTYAYDISKQIRAISGEKYIIKETTLYSALNRMEKNGFVTSFDRIAENGKKRTYYQITPMGSSYYTSKCQEWNLTRNVIELFIGTPD